MNTALPEKPRPPVNPIYARRRRTDIFIRLLCVCAAMFGVTWLALILFTLFYNGLAGISLQLFTQNTPPPASTSGGLLNAIVGSIIMTVLGVVVGAPLGLFAGLYPRNPISKLLMTGSIVGFSLPTFWVGLMLIMFFSVHLGVLPASGRGETVSVFGVEWSFLTADGLRHLILPALNLSLFKISLVLRLTRAGVTEVLPQDFVKFARAKGLSPLRVVLVHVLRNTLIPLVTVIGLEFGSTIAFAVVTESVFAWPGAGKLILDSINSLDRPVIVAYLIVVVCLFVSLNLIVDVLYKWLDPRVRVEAAA